ncbi:MAG: hypothetical protein P8181_16660, partial [bacterium]
YTAEPVTLEVAKSAAAPRSRGPAQAPDTQGEGVLPDGEDRPIFIRASVDRDTVYVNQQITWTLGF